MTAVDDPRPLCFVLMPFGMKSDPGGNVTIDFDAYTRRLSGPRLTPLPSLA
jgi:hypothetical protein